MDPRCAALVGELRFRDWKQRLEAGDEKMPVGGKRLSDSKFLHENEARAIRERVALIGMLFEEIDRHLLYDSAALRDRQSMRNGSGFLSRSRFSGVS